MAADFNNDGRTDLAVTDPILNEVSILLGNGDGTFQTLHDPVPRRTRMRSPRATSPATGRSTWPWPIAISSSVTILLGNGDGTFTLGQTITLVNPADPTNPFDFPGRHRGRQLHE